MEYVDGTTLGRLLARKGPLEPRTAVGYILQAARGLQFAHERGMVHRDIKPDNLMLNTRGIVKVADLGLVKLRRVADEAGPAPGAGLRAAAAAAVTQAHVAMGTPAYMAPEQANDSATVDARADVYSLG